MNRYMVEVTLRSVVDDNWTDLRRMTDIVPGTVLLEDFEAPVLILPVDAETAPRAAVFVEGIASIVGLEIISGQISEIPADEVDEDDDGDQIEAGFEPSWVKVPA